MNQIAIGDSSGWTVLDGQSVAAPFRRAAPFFALTTKEQVREKIEITLAGTPAQITTALSTLQKAGLRALAYARGEYAHLQYLRFQQIAGGSYYYAQLSEIAIEENPTGYRDHQKGSLLVSLHYTRPNYFDGDQEELPLTGRGGTDVTGGITIKNHTDAGAADGNTVLIKSADAVSDLPAPLRLEILNTTVGASWYRALIGAYHHPTFTGENPFFCQATDMTGGTQYMNVAAINSYYRTFTWTSSAWASFLTYVIPSSEIDDLDGRTYRPILNLYESHAYTDLHFRIRLMFGTYVLYVGEAVYADPDYDYIFFPPIQLPPNQLLREVNPMYVEVNIQGFKEDGAAVTLKSDQLLLFPVEYALVFDQFFPFSGATDKLVYDAHRSLSNIRYGGTTETVSHIRQGGPLLLYPNENTRLFFNFYDSNNNLPIEDTAQIKAFYRPRVSVL